LALDTTEDSRTAAARNQVFDHLAEDLVGQRMGQPVPCGIMRDMDFPID
jgi:hypothetical protein